MRLSLKTKTVLGTALIEGVLLLVLVFTANRFMTQLVNDNLQKRATTAATLFATTTKNAVLAYDLASLESFVLEVLTNPDIEYARVLDSNGRVFAQAGTIPRQDFVADQFVASVDDGVFDTFSNIVEAGQLYGRVEIGVGVSQLQKSINDISRWTATIALIEMLLVGLFSFVLGSLLTRQLVKLKKATKTVSVAVSQGKFEAARVEVIGSDELSDVAAAFNDLVDNLEHEHHRNNQYQIDLQTLNATLEDRVKRRTLALEQAQQALVQTEKMASIGQLAAGVAHEINNPVGYVTSNIEVLSKYVSTYVEIATLAEKLLCENNSDPLITENYKREIVRLVEEVDIEFLNEDVGDLLTETKAGLERVTDIVSSLKSFTRLDADKKQMFCINTCIETTYKMVQRQLNESAKVVLELQKIPETMLNVGKINQVLTNLMINASQAVASKAKPDEMDDCFGNILITSRFTNNIVIEIKDDGAGIEPENLTKIFEPFFTTKPEGEGTGLGLGICYEIIREHNGTIDVRSTAQEGTIFTITLPVMDEFADN